MFKKFVDKIFGKKDEVKEDLVEKLEATPDASDEIEENLVEELEATPDASDGVEEDLVEKLEETPDASDEIEEDLVEELEETPDASDEIEEDLVEELEETPDASDEIEEDLVEKLEETPDASDEIEEDLVEELEETPDASDEVKEDLGGKAEEVKKIGFFEKLKQGLSKTRDNFTGQISSIIKSYQKVDEELFDEIEEVLITADVGIETTMDLIDNLRNRVKEEKVSDPEDVMGLLKSEIEKIMLRDDLNHDMNIEPSPAVILVVGVNGVGKTTTIGKMAARYKNEGKKVLVAAGDTFRAAAIEQLEEWGNRAGVDIISHSEGSDPAAVIFDGIQAAKARKIDVLICDTAGRLHNKANLMNELSKIFRVLDKEYAEAKKEVLLVLDATTGQNAMSQAKVFKEATNITGIALTKLDGTAKGGVVIALQSELGVPIKFVGVGEGIEDLQVFNAKDFIDAIFEK